MQQLSLSAVADEQSSRAQHASQGRSAQTVCGGRGQVLSHTVLALTAGTALPEHDNPGEATVYVLRGRVRLATKEMAWEGAAEDMLIVPDSPHSLEALEDATVLLTIAKPR